MRVPRRASQPDAAQGGAEMPFGEVALPPELDHAITEALARSPDVAIPADFAARVSRSARMQVLPAPGGRPGWGARLAVGSGVALTAALFAIAPLAVPSLHNGWFDAELGMLAELCALVLFSHRLLGRR